MAFKSFALQDKDAIVWAGRAARGHRVLQADLAALGLRDFGSLPYSGGDIDTCNQLASQKMQLYHNSRAMVLARFPDLSADGDWRFMYATDGIPNGFSVAAGANATRVLAWAKEEAPFVHGYWDWDWADSIQAVVRMPGILVLHLPAFPLKTLSLSPPAPHDVVVF